MGTIQIDGSTPKLTIGNATAEDATILFDGNAQDFYIALDDSADDLLIGLGSTVGTTPAISIDENLKVAMAADATVGDDLTLLSDSSVLGFGADTDTTLTHTDGTGLTLNSTNKLCFYDSALSISSSTDGQLDIDADTEVEITTTTVDLNGALDVSGNSQFSGTVTVGVDDTGKDVKFFGASAGAYMEWDESADQLRIMGASADATTSTGKLLLATSLTDINANDVIGKIDFQAPHEAGGTDAIMVAASIQAIAQGTFSSSVNATDLIFYTGHSEAAAEKIRITSQNEIGIAGANYGTDGQVLTSGGAGAAVAWEDAAGGGEETDEIDFWGITATLDATVDNSSTVISANWARATYGGQDKLGTGLSESSGVFSFPSTGFYLISWQAQVQTDATATSFGMHLQTTQDNSTYTFRSGNYGALNSGTGHITTHPGFFIFDVTNTTNDKFRFYYYSNGADNNFVGSSSANKTSFYCIKLADT